jgi:hypothetical protein
MTTSYSHADTSTFTLASAQYVASKVAADLRQLQRWYGHPSDQEILDYAVEAAVLAHRGYLKKVIYGFRRNGAWVLTLEYTAVAGTLAADDRAGGVYRHADVAGAQFHSYLYRTDAWWQLTTAERHAVDAAAGIRRVGAQALGYTGGQHIVDRAYSARGTGLQRSSYHPL